MQGQILSFDRVMIGIQPCGSSLKPLAHVPASAFHPLCQCPEVLRVLPEPDRAEGLPEPMLTRIVVAISCTLESVFM